MTDFTIRQCRKETGYRVIVADKEYQDIIELLASNKQIEFDVKTQHLSVFHYQSKKVSVFNNNLTIRDCTRQQAEEIAKQLLKS